MKKLISLIAVAATVAACGQVEDNEVCFEKTWGEYDSKILSTGINWYNPISTDMICINARARQYSSKMEAFTKDKQTLYVEYIVNWRVIKEEAMTMHKELGSGYMERAYAEVRNAINIILQKNNLDVILLEQTTMQNDIQKLANERLAKFHMVIDSIVIDTDPTNDYKAAVAEKQIAKEKALAEANRTEQEKQKASQLKIAAQAEAEAMRIKTNALAQSKSLIEYERVQVEKIQAERWNGQLPTSIYGSAPLPIMNLK